MPAPMVHFSVAIGACRQAGREPTPEFVLGCIAPDAIHMRPGTDRSDKRHTHLLDRDGPTLRTVRDWLCEHLDGNPAHYQILTGYGVHLLTDGLWRHSVVAELRGEMESQLDRDHLRTLYYRETDQIDIKLYRSALWRPALWEKLAEAQAYDIADLVTADEIDRWRNRTLGWFDAPEHDPGIVPEHVTEERVVRFIDEAAIDVYETLML